MHDLDQLRHKILDDQDVPQPVRDFLRNGADLEEIRLDARGRWSHQGEPFLNERLAALFHRSVQRTSSGNHVLHIPPYTYPIIVELTHRFVDTIAQPATTTTATLLDGATVTLDLTNLYTDGIDIIACSVPDGPARLVNRAYRTLTERLDERDGQFVLRLDDRDVTLAPLPDGFFNA